MFNLIIVDDEQIIINGLSTYINWNELNFNIVGTATSMEEALELVENFPVDVVLTDIRMEFNSGLDLIAHLSEYYPDIKTVILSGYGEFEYAQQALKLGTFDFLTKPVDLDILKKTFEKLNHLLQDSNRSQKQHEEYLQLRRSIFLNNLAKENSQLVNPSLAAELGIKLSSHSMQIIRLRIENHQSITHNTLESKQLLIHLIDTAFYSKGNYYTFNNLSNEITILMYDCPEETLTEDLSFLHAKFPSGLTIGLSNTFTHLDSLYQAYFEADKALDYKIIKRNSSIIYFKSIEDTLYIDNIISPETNIEITDLLRSKDTHKLNTFIADRITIISKSSNSVNLIYSFCIELLLIIDKFLKTYNTNYTNGAINNIIRKVIVRDNIADILAFISNYILSIDNYIAESVPCSGSIIKDAQSYILEHYAENITLNTLANILFIHPVYLSKLFKEKTNKNFIDFLTDVRIAKAKQLLNETTLKVYNISEMVGYESSKYFSKLFRSATGSTPTQYRDDSIKNSQQQ